MGPDNAIKMSQLHCLICKAGENEAEDAVL
jgi:hypothetical protein